VPNFYALEDEEAEFLNDEMPPEEGYNYQEELMRGVVEGAREEWGEEQTEYWLGVNGAQWDGDTPPAADDANYGDAHRQHCPAIELQDPYYVYREAQEQYDSAAEQTRATPTRQAINMASNPYQTRGCGYHARYLAPTEQTSPRYWEESEPPSPVFSALSPPPPPPSSPQTPGFRNASPDVCYPLPHQIHFREFRLIFPLP
jgi:hypothetical protein